MKFAQTIKPFIKGSGIWLGLGSSTEAIFRFLRNMILTRLLAPEALGTMSIVLSVNALLEVLTSVGIKTAIIQNPGGEENTYLNGAWWLSVGRVLGLYTIAYISAPFISTFYQNENLTSLTRVAFLAFIINGLMSPKAYTAMKKMNFKRWVTIFNGGGIIGIIITLILVPIFENVWALVIGFIAEAFARTVLSHILCPYKPSFNFSHKHLKELFKFARGMFGIPILYFIFMRTDIFVIGKLLSVKELGLYAMAANLARMPLQFLGSIINDLLMPALSKKQDEKLDFNQLIVQSIAAIAFLGFPLLIFILCYSAQILYFVYGKSYVAVAVPLKIIFASEFLRVLSIPIATAYLAIGEPQLHRFFNIIRAILMLVLIYPLVKIYGLTGAATAGLISVSIALIYQMRVIQRLTGFNLKINFRNIIEIACIAFVIIFFWESSNLFNYSWLIKLIIGLFSCVLSYLALLLYLPVIKKNVLIK
ncbi:MAG: Teichuronic acid biosynthesis protein TuaB [Syntrophus sp. PtaB.Bin001]|nr:MAG: Teichuronic acid biosynthesis protein TuaB [Syntrophus sp. PtaB.Bin001]